MAVGEAACVSVHGANRLGSNSLIDLVVFGRAAAMRAATIVKPNSKHEVIPESETQKSISRFDKLRKLFHLCLTRILIKICLPSFTPLLMQAKLLILFYLPMPALKEILNT